MMMTMIQTDRILYDNGLNTVFQFSNLVEKNMEKNRYSNTDTQIRHHHLWATHPELARGLNLCI